MSVGFYCCWLRVTKFCQGISVLQAFDFIHFLCWSNVIFTFKLLDKGDEVHVGERQRGAVVSAPAPESTADVNENDDMEGYMMGKKGEPLHQLWEVFGLRFTSKSVITSLNIIATL